ncbi:hypothetical protein AB9M75_03995 [Lactobacillus sp. AN1001]
MALEKSKSMTLTGVSKVGNDVVVSLTANLSTDSNSSDYVNQSVRNPSLYTENKREVRKDILEFQNYVYDQQDLIDQETTEEDDAGDK